MANPPQQNMANPPQLTMANPPQQNMANLNAAGGNIALPSAQPSIQYQQATNLMFVNQLKQIQQHLDRIEAKLNIAMELSAAIDWNARARLDHGRINQATTGLVEMRSVSRAPNAPLRIGQPIPNFPATAGEVSDLADTACWCIIAALDHPISANPRITAKELRTTVSRAMGLPAL